MKKTVHYLFYLLTLIFSILNKYFLFLGKDSIWFDQFFMQHPKYRIQLINAIINALKVGSQDTYESHFIQYIYWCLDRFIKPFEFPTPYTRFAAFS